MLKRKKEVKKKPGLQELLKEIEGAAYGYFQKRGYEYGHNLEDWLKAEKEVKKRYGIK